MHKATFIKSVIYMYLVWLATESSVTNFRPLEIFKAA